MPSHYLRDKELKDIWPRSGCQRRTARGLDCASLKQYMKNVNEAQDIFLHKIYKWEGFTFDDTRFGAFYRSAQSETATYSISSLTGSPHLLAWMQKMAAV